MSNVVDLKSVRTLRDCERLFTGYKNRLSVATKEQLQDEMVKFQTEIRHFPNHLLTLVKGRILLKTLLNNGSTNPNTARMLQTLDQRVQERHNFRN